MSITAWLIMGAIFVVLEVAALPGFGLLFAGLAAITLGGLLTYDVITAADILDQIVWFFAFTALWWVVLWKPLKKLIKKQPGEETYENLAGTYGTVDDERDLTEGKIGFVKWSGTRMRASLRKGASVQRVKNGETVYVHSQKDGVLMVDVVKPEISE